MSGSDFAPEFFSSEENKTFNKILTQLRSFERSVAQSFRQVDGRLEIIEESLKKNKDGLTGTKGSVTKLRNSLTELQTNLEEKIGKIEKMCKANKNNGNENIDEVDGSFIDESANTLIGLNEEDNEDNEQIIMTMDPFLGNGAFVGTFDGNPTVPFAKWIEKFKDILSLMTEPTEAQKLARLRFCLAGQARISFDSINPVPATLAEAIAYLKGKYENGNNKVIARQLLSNCRHAPGESVFEFANRLSDTVRTALSGDDEETIKRRLLDEFLDRLIPELQFEVKAQRPQDYANAYEIAQHYELLLSARKTNQISVASLAEKVEALAIQNRKNNEKIVCYNCRRVGHIAKHCRSRNNGYTKTYQPQNFGRYENRFGENNQNRRQNYQNYGENRNYRKDNSQRREVVAGNIVSNGLFAFLRGGILTINQFWVFICCCFVTFQFLLQFVLPSILAGPLNYLNIGEAIFNGVKRYRKKKKSIEQLKNQENENESNNITVPLSRRWPSFNKVERGDKPKNTKTGKNKPIFLLTNGQCDKNSRILAEINGRKILCLLDTGAHVSLINMENAKRMGIKNISSANFPAVYGIGNKLVPTLGQASVELKIADCKIYTNFIIVKDGLTKSESYSAIIGRETLNNLPLLLNFTNWELTKISSENGNKYEVNFGEADHLSKIIENTKIEKLKKEIFTKCLNKYRKIFSKNDYDLGKCKNLVLVEKSDGKLRPCVDFRPLNKITVTDPYPIPRMEQVIHRVAGKKFYSTFGFCAQKCGIITEWGLYEMTRLPFGLKNAPSIFQRVMDKVLKEMDNVTAYIDDILVHSDNFESHIETLKDVFNRLDKAGLKLKGEKCKFLETNCIYLGHEITKEGYRPSLTNCEAIKNFPTPSNVKEVKRFLGLTSFFRKFISNFASIAWPLNDLTRGKERKFEWGEKEENSFNKLKQNLIKSPCLRAPNYELPFHLFCDASSVAYASALMQSLDGKDLHAVGYWSRTLTKSEEKLPATHGELAAIYHSIVYFKPIIYGTKLTIHTDHRPLTFLFTKASTNTKINRWLMAMQDVQPSVVYVEGKANKVADALSRVPSDWSEIISKNPREDIPYLMKISVENINRKTIEEAIQSDPILESVFTAIKNNWEDDDYPDKIKPYFKIRDKLYIKDKLIMKKPQNQIVIPEKLRSEVLKLIHVAHFGIVRSKAKARKIIWWPEINIDIENFISECQKCQSNMPNEPQTSHHNNWPEAKIGFERIHIDLAGPVFGKTFLLIVDAYSRYPFVAEMKSTTSSYVINALREIFSFFGPPSCLVSDNGPQFISFEFETFLKENGVNHIKSPPYHPQSNGLCERFVRTFKTSISKVIDSNNLQRIILEFLNEYRASPHPSLDGDSPSYLFLGRQIKSKIDILKFAPKENFKHESGETVDERVTRKRKLFSVGDLVWARNYNTQTKWAAGTVVQEKGEYLYGIEMENGAFKISHIDQLRSRGSYKLRSRSQREIRKEALATREAVQKSHDFIREAMENMKKELVKDVIMELNPRFIVLEELLKEIKEDKKCESESGDSDNDNEEEEEEEIHQENENTPAQQENQQPAQHRGEENNREIINNNHHGRRYNRGRGQNARRPRDSRLFYLLRQIDRERGFDTGYDRYRPYYPRDRGEFNREGYRGRNDFIYKIYKKYPFIIFMT
uniref:RNA-directed DNA polymerase n=1 Tax=Meloidogyne hapla TaxID=6305 RepID=A0A1I8BC51_MELHA